MINLMIEQHKELKNGIYIYNKPDCRLCVSYFKVLETRNTEDWYSVDCSQDEEYFIEQGIDSMPLTRYYVNDNIVWQKGGVLFDFQVNDLLNTKQLREARA